MYVRALILLAGWLTACAAGADGHADAWTFGGVAAVSLQCQQLEDTAGGDVCRFAAPVQPEVSFRPDEANEWHLGLGFAAGNGLMAVSPFSIPVWAADLEDDVRHLNGSGRSHLLTAWYRHAFDLAGGQSMGITAGLIDGTDFLDDNALANDEFSQFMNAALVNGPNGFVPSFDPGLALEWDSDVWSLRGVYMRAGPERHDYLGLQAGYRLQTALGEGTYRLLLQTTSNDFSPADGSREVSRQSWTVSADQRLGPTLGVWVRIGSQDDSAEVDFKSLYSGGVTISGHRWRRPQDELAFGLALARGGNLEIESSRVIEGYYRMQFSDRWAVTADLQHLEESASNGDRSASGLVAGLRLTFTF